MNRETFVPDLRGYYKITALDTYCYFVSWTMQPVPGSGDQELRRSRYLCRKCTPGPFRATFGRYRLSAIQQHLLQEHGIKAKDKSLTSKRTSPERVYRALIPQEDFVESGGTQICPNEMLWRWAYASEKHRVSRDIRTPPDKHMVAFREAETPCIISDARKSSSDSFHSEEKSRGPERWYIEDSFHSKEKRRELVHWNEELWLQLINAVKNMDDRKMSFQKWTKIPALLSPDLVAKFTDEAVSQRVLRFRFLGLSHEVQRNRKISRYTRGVTEAVIIKMREYCHTKTSSKIVQKNCTDYKRRSSENFPSIETNIDLKLGKQFDSVVKMLDNQLLPTAKEILESSLRASKLFLSETKTTEIVLKLAIQFAYQHIRTHLISQAKEVTLCLKQEIMRKLKTQPVD